MVLPLFFALACATPPEPPSCDVARGQSTVEVEVDGTTRTAVVHRGAKAGPDAPMVFVWHGFGASAASIIDVMRPETLWEDALVIAPEGLGRTFPKFGDVERPGWQIAPGEQGDRDLAFFDALTGELSSCADAKKVFSTGFSNGGHVSHVLACTRPEQVQAIAPVGGAKAFETSCEPVPTLITHGRRDEVVPYTKAEAAIAAWSESNGCAAQSVGAGCHALSCDTPLTVCTFDGGHSWPRGATEEITSFFRSVR